MMKQNIKIIEQDNRSMNRIEIQKQTLTEKRTKEIQWRKDSFSINGVTTTGPLHATTTTKITLDTNLPSLTKIN